MAEQKHEPVNKETSQVSMSFLQSTVASRTVLGTGGLGYIGSHTVVELRGWNSTQLDTVP